MQQSEVYLKPVKDGAFSENSERLTAVYHFRKTLHLKWLIGL